MKQYIIFICTSAILISLAAAAAVFQVKTDELAIVQQQTSVKKDVYILKNYNGRLAVFNEKSTEPIITTDTLVGDLPLSDREKLESGLIIDGDTKLRIALEDYCS